MLRKPRGWGRGVTPLKQDTNKIILNRPIKPASVHVFTLYFIFNNLSTSGRIIRQSIETPPPDPLDLAGNLTLAWC